MTFLYEAQSAQLDDPEDSFSTPSHASGTSSDENLTDHNERLYLSKFYPQARWRLYVSHFLSTWNSRLFEFGAVLFLASIFPGTLLPLSSYALVRAASAIILSPAVGRYIDNGNRLRVVQLSIRMSYDPL